MLAIHCSIDDQEQVLLYTRSNWKWYCKQQILVSSDSADKLTSLIWVKKYQICLVHANGRLTFTEYCFEYSTSSSNYNMGTPKDNHGYVAVVDGAAINLTPLGKFVMPPPMFEKQVVLPFTPNSINLYGHSGVAFVEHAKSLFTFDCGQEAPVANQYQISDLL